MFMISILIVFVWAQAQGCPQHWSTMAFFVAYALICDVIGVSLTARVVAVFDVLAVYYKAKSTEIFSLTDTESLIKKALSNNNALEALRKVKSKSE